MITTQPFQINTQYNTKITLSILYKESSKKLMLLAKDLEKTDLTPIDYIILTSTEIYCLCKDGIKLGNWSSFELLRVVIAVINKYNKHVNAFDLTLTEYSLEQRDVEQLKNFIDSTARDIYYRNHARSTMAMFDEKYQDAPEWFRNGIWIIPSLPKSKL